MAKKIILITGGARSGKSSCAERMALSLSSSPVYMATAHVWDDEFRERVRRHQERRGPEWTNIEEEQWLSRHDVAGRVVLVDCLTLWATNFFFGSQQAMGKLPEADALLAEMQAEFDRLTAQEATFIFVTNEIGMGGTSTNDVQRRFTDIQGWMNQYVAARADEVILMVCGLPMTIKTSKTPLTPHPLIQNETMRNYNISRPDEALREAIQQKIDNLNKPKGSLGRLEELAMQVCLVQQTLSPSLDCPCHLLLGGDHGIEKEGVSVSPRDVTWQQMINFTRGGGGVNMFCRQHGFRLKIVDTGVDYDLSGISGITDCKIARGTANFLYGPAMSEEQFDEALSTGGRLVDDCASEGCRVLSVGEMGIANTSPSSIWMSIFCEIPLDECIGAGAGLDDEGIRHKKNVLSQAVRRFKESCGEHPDVATVLRYFGGFEMITAIGAMLRAAERRMIVLVDGFIMTACALGALRLCPEAESYMVFAHAGDESGHSRMLNAMGARPLLRLGLRLGEGTGALCAFPIIDSAVRMINEMNNFDNARITKYF